MILFSPNILTKGEQADFEIFLSDFRNFGILEFFDLSDFLFIFQDLGFFRTLGHFGIFLGFFGIIRDYLEF